MLVRRLSVTTANWPWIEQLLRPAIVHDKRATVYEVHEKLRESRAGLASLHVEGGAALVVIEPTIENDVPVLWLNYFAGAVRGGPQRWLSVIRQGVRYFEEKARETGQREIRVGGRDWSRVLPDYHHYDPAKPNSLRKVLI